jgi:hypothetical protein
MARTTLIMVVEIAITEFSHGLGREEPLIYQICEAALERSLPTVGGKTQTSKTLTR